MAEEKPEETAEEPEVKEEPEAEEAPKEGPPKQALSLQESGEAAEAALAEEPEKEEEKEEEQEEVEEEVEVIVPAIVTRHRPELAEMWKGFTPEQRDNIRVSVGEQLLNVAGKVETVDGQQGTQDRAIEPEEPTEQEKADQPSRTDVSEPVVIAEDDCKPLLDFLDGDEAAQGAMKTLIKAVNSVVGEVHGVGTMVAAALEEQGGKLVSIEDARALEDAIVEHQGDFTMLIGPNCTKQDVAKIEAEAKEIIEAGRVVKGNWSDAVSLALHKRKANKSPEETPEQRAERARTAKVAGSLGTTPQSPRHPRRRVPQTIAQAGDQAEEDLAK